MGNAIRLAKPFGFLLAYIFGKISPNNSTTAVIIPTSNKNCNHGCDMDSKNNEVSDAKTSTVAMLIRLLSNKIIAKSRLGFLRKCAMIRSDLFDAFVASLMYDGANEKKATSAPETSAEPSKSSNNKTTFTVSSVSKPKTK